MTTPTPALRAHTQGRRTPRRLRSERGSGTLLTLFVSVLLLPALALAVLWSAASVARHKLAAAADLAALSAAQTLQSGTPDPCPTADRIATAHDVQLTNCQVIAETVTIQVATHLNLHPLLIPPLTTTARAGPT